MEEIDQLRNDMFLLKFKNEIEFINNNDESHANSNYHEMDASWKKERIKILSDIIHKYTSHSDSDQANDELAQMFADQDREIYKKQWHTLKPKYRMNLIEKYLEETYKDPLKSNIHAKIKPLIYKGKLNLKKFVVYDRKLGKITEIPALKVSKKGKIEIGIK